jgi:hypothetical protein
MVKRKIEGGAVRAKTYPLMADAVEVGVLRGWNRARKHVEHPGEEWVRSAIEQAVLEEICERFDFDTYDE